MNVNVQDLLITSLDTITCFSLQGEPRFILDELQDATIANAEEKVDLTGRAGRKLGSLKRNKAVTITGTNGMISGGMLEAQVGSAFENKEDAEVKRTEYLTVGADNTVTLSFDASGKAGEEISAVWVKDGSGVASKKLTQDTAAASGKFAYSTTDKKITFADADVNEGDEVVVFYFSKVKAAVLSNDSTKFSEKLDTYVDCSGEDKCGNVYYVQVHIPKGDFSGEFDIALGDDQATHPFTIESLAGSCGAGGMLWTYTVFGVDA